MAECLFTSFKIFGPNDLLYSWKQRELRAVLDFMYNGEVSVAQDWLNSFLMAAEELAIKGLTSAESVNAGQTQLLDDFQVMRCFLNPN